MSTTSETEAPLPRGWIRLTGIDGVQYAARAATVRAVFAVENGTQVWDGAGKGEYVTVREDPATVLAAIAVAEGGATAVSWTDAQVEAGVDVLAMVAGGASAKSREGMRVVIRTILEAAAKAGEGDRNA